MNVLSGYIVFERKLNEEDKKILVDAFDRNNTLLHEFDSNEFIINATGKTICTEDLETLRKLFEHKDNRMKEGSIVFEGTYGDDFRFFLRKKGWTCESKEYLSLVPTNDLKEELKERASETVPAEQLESIICAIVDDVMICSESSVAYDLLKRAGMTDDEMNLCGLDWLVDMQ